MRYHPSNIVVGYYDANVLGMKSKFGYPSCKWLKDGSYTDISTFSRATNGIKPHMQRDPEKQISKDLGITIGSFNNDFIDGFKIIEIKTNNYHVILKDPRGFYIALRIEWLNKLITKYHCNISSSGDISGKWAYIWDNKHFTGLLYEDEALTIDVNDYIIDEIDRNSQSFSLKDLVPGTIYNAYGEDKDKTKTERYVYLGTYEMYNLNAVRIYLTSYLYQKHLRDLVGFDSASPTDNRFPWINKKFKSIYNALEKSFKKYPVFVKLKDNILHNSSIYSLCKESPDIRLYCDVLANDKTDEHSIRYSLGTNSSLEINSKLIKRIVGKSESQDIRMDDNVVTRSRQTWCELGMTQYYNSAAEYKTFSFKMLKDGFEKFLSLVNDTVKERMEVSPIQRPKDFPKWKLLVKEYYMKYKNDINSYTTWLM